MPTYITQGRYTREAIRGMIAPPEDSAADVARPLGKVGGAVALLAAGRGNGVTDLKTTLALTSIEAKGAFAAASDLASSFKSAAGALEAR